MEKHRKKPSWRNLSATMIDVSYRRKQVSCRIKSIMIRSHLLRFMFVDLLQKVLIVQWKIHRKLKRLLIILQCWSFCLYKPSSYNQFPINQKNKTSLKVATNSQRSTKAIKISKICQAKTKHLLSKAGLNHNSLMTTNNNRCILIPKRQSRCNKKPTLSSNHLRKLMTEWA